MTAVCACSQSMAAAAMWHFALNYGGAEPGFAEHDLLARSRVWGRRAVRALPGASFSRYYYRD